MKLMRRYEKSPYFTTRTCSKIDLQCKAKKFATSYLQCKVKQIVRNSNTYVGFYFSAVPYADLYSQ